MIFFITVNVLGLLPYCNNTSSLSQGVHAEVYITVVKKRYNSRYTLEDLFDKIPVCYFPQHCLYHFSAC